MKITRFALLLSATSALAAGCGDGDDDDMGTPDGGGPVGNDGSTQVDAPPPPDGQPTVSDMVAFTRRANDNTDVYVVGTNGMNERNLTDGRTAPDLFPSWDPDGTRLVIATGLPATPAFVDVATGTVTPVTTTLFSVAHPSFSPDGDTLLFEGRSADSLPGDIYTMPAAGGDHTQLTMDAGVDAGPVFSPDGMHVYFSSDRGGGFDVWRIDADGANPTRITTGTNIVGKPTISPSGKVLAYAKPQSNQTTRVYLYDLAAGTETLLVDVHYTEPSFSSDGRVLGVTSMAGSGSEIELVDAANGASLGTLTADPALDGSPSLSPLPL